MDGADADVAGRLIGIGLDEREAKLYVDLLLHGASRASDAASRAKLKRTETYRALESLMKRGFVAAQLTRPVRYEAIDPRGVFEDLLARHDRTRQEIERLEERLAQMASGARERREEAASRRAYRIIQGRRAIHAALESMLRGARGEADLVTAQLTPSAVGAANRAYQATLRRATEGLRVRFLLRGHAQFPRALGALLELPHVQVRYADLPVGLRFAIADGKEILFWLVSDPSVSGDAREDVAMWTNAPDFIDAQGRLFDAVWESANASVRTPA